MISVCLIKWFRSQRWVKQNRCFTMRDTILENIVRYRNWLITFKMFWISSPSRKYKILHAFGLNFVFVTISCVILEAWKILLQTWTVFKRLKHCLEIGIRKLHLSFQDLSNVIVKLEMETYVLQVLDRFYTFLASF